MSRTYFPLLTLATLFLALGHAAAADTPSATLEVLQIRATTSNTEISPGLKNLAEQLKSQFKFTGFKLIGPASLTVTRDKAASLGFTGNYSATVKVVSRTAERVKLDIEIFAEKDGKKSSKARTTVEIAVGKYALIGGLSLDGGDTLILAFSAK
jgi:hypothetical protein